MKATGKIFLWGIVAYVFIMSMMILTIKIIEVL